MLELRPVEWLEIQGFMPDFQKHSKCFELPPEEGECVGIYNDDVLAGYFIVVRREKGLEINQGYLKSEFRHKGVPLQSLTLLEDIAKKAGLQRIELGTESRFKAYIPFMKAMGYKPTRIYFGKEL